MRSHMMRLQKTWSTEDPMGRGRVERYQVHAILLFLVIGHSNPISTDSL